MFTDCRSLPVTYTFSDPSIFKLVEGRSKSKEDIVLVIFDNCPSYDSLTLQALTSVPSYMN